MKEDRLVYKTYIPKYLPAHGEYLGRLLGSDLSNSLNVYRYGQILAALDEYDRAIDLYTGYLQRDPTNQGFTFLLEELKNLKARHTPTQTSTPAPLPDEVMVYINQADTHIANNDLAAAREAIKKALTLASGHAQLSSMLSNMLTNLRPSEAADEFLGTKSNDR
jgi:tetratricopeptide (TPR) repeat protein